jgi:hypothetical protein
LTASVVYVVHRRLVDVVLGYAWWSGSTLNSYQKVRSYRAVRCRFFHLKTGFNSTSLNSNSKAGS